MGYKNRGNKCLWTTKTEKRLIPKVNIDTVIIAIQNPKAERRKALLDECINLKIKVQKVPEPKAGSMENLPPKPFVKAKIEDLLGREEIKLNIEQINKNPKRKNYFNHWCRRKLLVAV